MFENTSAADYLAALSAFEHAAERLAQANPIMLSSEQLLDGLRRLERAARTVPSCQHWLTEVGIEQDLPYRLGYTGVKELLVDQLGLAGAEARERIMGARSRAPRQERGFAPEPRLPRAASAQRAGDISDRHALAIERALGKCSRRLSQADQQDLEDMLVTAAVRGCTPDDITRLGRRAYELLDPDGAEPSAQDVARARDLTVRRQGDDLMSEFGGALSPEARALLDVVLEKLARPGVINPEEERPVDIDDPAAVAEAARRDRRTAAQRNHDALVTALRTAIGSGALGRHRGLPCVPIITMGIDRLTAETGIATTATGGRLPVADALTMMGANPKYALLLDLSGRPLYLGRENRLASTDQRIALYGSEKGCSAPGCDAPATRCQVHHKTERRNGGATDISVLTLACDAHHGKVVPSDDEIRRGFETVTVPDDDEFSGRTGWRRSGDPAGRFRVNHLHHPQELHRLALRHHQQRRRRFADAWRAEDLRVQYRDLVGTIYDDISATLDGPNGPPLLEAMLSEHDADNIWRVNSPWPLDAAA
ncbi:HNH endonuclease signature motif containing protein [Tsukamurella serpentis]